jgi:hypothetical protein
MSDPEPDPADRAGHDRLRQTLEGRTTLDVGAVLGEAWRRSDGARGILFGGFLAFYVLFVGAVLLVAGLLEGLGLDVQRGVGGALLNLIVGAVSYPFLAGVFMVGLRRAVGAPIAFSQLLGHYDRVLELVVLNALASLGIAFGLLLFVVPGIYLGVAWSLAMPLLIDRRLGIFDALETSRKLVTKHWFSVFALCLIGGLLLLLGAFTFGIALIWTLPWTTLAFAILYRELAGARSVGGESSPAAPDDERPAGDDEPPRRFEA